MGASASRGWDNESLIDKLLDGGLSLPPDLERAMRLVDRGDYFEEKNSRAYMDLAWRSGSLHLSAPSIYISALNNLDLASGQHFLNVGSGSGYLSTIIGLVLGHKGINHGIELNKNNVAFSKQRLATFLTTSDAPCERDFCIPQFIQGNIFDLLIPPSLRNGSIHRSDASRDSEGNSDSEDEEVHFLSMNEEPVSDHEMQVATEESCPVNSQAEGRESVANDGNGPRRSRRTRTAVLQIDLPPIVQNDIANVESNNGIKRWPMYDRIYVGGGIRNRVQLQALLRLLKIGGIMVAPVQNELLKITRLSENRIRHVDLLSVSFASLVVPSVNNASYSVEPPPPIEIPSLLRLSARLIRHLLRTRIELYQNGRPTLGRLVEFYPHGSMKKKRRKNSSNGEHVVPEGEQSSPSSNGTDSSDDSESERSEHGENGCVINHDTVSGHTEENTSQDADQASSPSNRSDSPDLQRDGGSMVRFLHHLMLRSRMARSGGSAASRPSETQAAVNDSEGGDNPESNELDDPSRILVLNLSSEPDNSLPENSTEISRSRMRFHLRVARRLMEVIDGAEERPETAITEEREDESNDISITEPVTNSGVASGSRDMDDHPSNPRHRQKKRRCGLKYQPPSYRYRDEMHRILSEELHMPEFFVRQVFTM